jgi:carbamoyltransferase
MLVMGMCGGLDPQHGNRLEFPIGQGHDAAAVLLSDGQLVAGIEQERLDRIKHSNKFPLEAIDFCLRTAGATLQDVERFAINVDESVGDLFILEKYIGGSLDTLAGVRQVVGQLLQDRFGRFDLKKLQFVNHHEAHALSAYAMSGFDEALVVTVDGAGPEGQCTTVWEGRGGRLKPIRNHRTPHSLGFFYNTVIHQLGYTIFDEYKVMGLAPYGDPARYRALLRSMYQLTPDGWFRVVHDQEIAHWTMYSGGLGVPRRRGDPFTQHHQDIAAALQEAVETILMHFFQHHRKNSGMERLCYAGGVAQNVTFNGKLAGEGLFKEMFIQPAAHDAGCALGAAHAAHRAVRQELALQPTKTVYWGSDIGTAAQIEKALSPWSDFVSVRRLAHPARETAELLAQGLVIGWMQGRSEFGPRALGNRSILADPRPAENKAKINAMVKKREAYRPFAPSVLEESASEMFELGGLERSPYMLFSLPTRESSRAGLGAVSHVDGSARIQTVSRDSNRPYWDLISAFKDLTGVPVLLNTSFNNDAEPIVESVEDGVVCFLTTKLDRLVVGDFLVEKRSTGPLPWEQLVVDLADSRRLIQTESFVPPGGRQVQYAIESSYSGHRRVPLSECAYRLILERQPTHTLGMMLDHLGITDGAERSEVLAEFVRLWEQRAVLLRPLGAT